jgi:hypothetical protein
MPVMRDATTTCDDNDDKWAMGTDFFIRLRAAQARFGEDWLDCSLARPGGLRDQALPYNLLSERERALGAINETGTLNSASSGEQPSLDLALQVRVEPAPDLDGPYISHVDDAQ